MNFTYLEKFPKFKKLHEYCNEAEEFALSKPSISAASARKAMEFVVKMIYQSQIAGYGESPTVFEMISDERFCNYVANPTIINSMHYIRKIGNIAAHGGSLSKDDSLSVLKELHFLVGEFCILLWLIRAYPDFIEPAAEAKPAAAPVAPAAVQKTEVKPAEPQKPEKVTVQPELIAEFGPRMRGARFNIKQGRNEEENKKLYLTASLREAGWPVLKTQNQAMPATASLNLMLDDGDTVDYVLYGRDNRPLAIIEYETTTKNPVEGRMKALEKAAKMEKKFGYKPIVYYTNGYLIYVIDHMGYKPRRVFQFHSIEELELLKLRAATRVDISSPQIDTSIAGRDYQKQAITGVCNAFMQNRRRALLVMATGTGKTRVSIALSDVLLKAGWAKNILFLADRTSLVRQAHKNFTKLLPSVTTSVYSGSSYDRDPNARIIFSTYQTMINLINDDTREFGIGRFDLIIIDEAHRSIFKKYAALFNYFDSLMVGLTATPRAEENKSTYQTFALKKGNPDFAYELEQAISDGFLVGFTVLDKTTDSLRRGVHYDELSEEEKEAFENSFEFGDVDLTGAIIEAKKIRSRKFVNLGTIDAMFNDLMKNGLKINGGDMLGKTIIFASSHFEAEQIVARFYRLYPHLGTDFCKLIDSHIANNLSLIDNFGERGNMPQIAVSVDMMDTGIDVPDVLNLVFFKKVSSKIKFLQMVGRGTRLSPDVFGPGMDKKGFKIFDYYDNFNFFRARNTWSTVDAYSNGPAMNVRSVSQLINEHKLGILRALVEKGERSDFEENYMNELKTYFHGAVCGLCNDDIEVQYLMAYVNKYRTAEIWDTFTRHKVEEITEKILPLLPADTSSVKVKCFDLMMYMFESQVDARISEGKDVTKIRYGYYNLGRRVASLFEELLTFKTIPEILNKEAIIKKMTDPEYIALNFSYENCEKLRLELRDLMKYLPEKREYIVINTNDFVIDSEYEATLETKLTYAEKANGYIEKGSVILSKIRSLEELTDAEKAELEDLFKTQFGTEADYLIWSENKPLLPYLRTQVGISDEAIQLKFGSFLNGDELSADQLEYMGHIISFAKENGDIVFLDLQRESPFCDLDVVELFGAKISHIKTLINGLHRPMM